LSPQYVEGTCYYIPHIYGFSRMTDVGSPGLPAKNHHIAIPYGSQAQIELLDVQFNEYSEKFKIHPALAPAPDCRGCPEPGFEINPGVYETDADFPREPVKIVDTDTYMGVPIAVIQVRPMQINPVTGTLKAYTRLKFKVTFSGRESTFDRYAASHTEHTNRMVRSAVLNRSVIPRGVDRNSNFTESRNGRKDYIMIVHSNYLAAAEALAAWKRQMGYSVEIVSQSSWTTTQVKSALQTRYDSWTPKPLFFLIFGDQADVPAEYPGSQYTDLYYAEMDGTGYMPEMAYGRIFPSSASNAQAIVDKIIDYEKNPPTLSGFYSNALACAYYQDSNLDSYADRRFTHTSEDIRNHLMGLGYGVNRVYVTGSSVDPLYYNNGNYSPAGMSIPAELKRPTFAWDGDATDIINYIDAGRFLVWHRDHGDVTLWGDPYFTTTNINQLNNGSLLPIVMSVNCLTGQFTGASECFCERFLRKETGGCVGIFGATNVSYSGPNDGYAPGIIDAIWPDPQIDPQYGSGGLGNPIPAHDPIYTMGDILNHSKIAMEYLWGLHLTTWELHHYFGDPAMKIWTAQPTVTTAAHTSTLNAGETSMAITSSNCPGGTATLVYESSLYGITTLAGDGTGTITFSPLSGVEPNAVLTVSKHNYKPYTANIPVAGGLPPEANFSGTPTTLMATDSVQFTDTSTMSPSSWEWTFEGGTPSTSTEQNPLITYNTAGTYTVTLIATNINGSDTETKTDYITVTPLQPPVADFTASATIVSQGDSVDFTDLSTNNPTSWSWTFAGGTPGTGTAQNPTITYNTPGTYTVTLTAFNGAGSDSHTKTNYIEVYEVLPTVGNTTVFSTTSVTPNRRAMPFTMPEDGTIFSVTMYHEAGSGSMMLGVYDGATLPGNRLGLTTATAVSGTAGWQTINLTAPVFVQGGTTVWLAWVYESIPGVRYDVGTPGRVQSPDLWAAGMPDPFGTGTQVDYIYSIYATYTTTGQAPVANFAASSTTITVGETVDFTDLSTNTPTAWDWTFNGGTPSSSTAQNPSVTYNTAGAYTVELTAANAYGSDTETRIDYITVEPGQPPAANFSASATTITEGGSVTFTDLSTNNPTAWDWTFAGGTPGTSTVQNPTITYNIPGNYTVTLTATNEYGSDTETKIDYITVIPQGLAPVANFTASATTINEGDSVTFTDLSTNTPTAWDWTFNGGTPGTGTAQNPTVTYNSRGVYTVILTATNEYGSDTETKVDYITVIGPTCIGEITNPGFETGSTSGWTVIGSASITLDPHSGLYAIFVDGTNSSVQQVITDLCPNTTYTVSCWGKGKTPAGAYLGVKNYGGAEQTVQFTDFKNYAQKSITFTTGSTNTTATIFFIKTSNKFDGTADDFTIIKN
jgi:PKD repeat protein